MDWSWFDKLVSVIERGEKTWNRIVFILVLIVAIILAWSWFSTSTASGVCIQDGLDSCSSSSASGLPYCLLGDN